MISVVVAVSVRTVVLEAAIMVAVEAATAVMNAARSIIQLWKNGVAYALTHDSDRLVFIIDM